MYLEQWSCVRIYDLGQCLWLSQSCFITQEQTKLCLNLATLDCLLLQSVGFIYLLWVEENMFLRLSFEPAHNVIEREGVFQLPRICLNCGCPVLVVWP